MAAPEIVLDLSRLLSRVLHPTPTGVDRVEMAYARGLVARAPDRLRFGAVHPLGRYGRLAPGAALRFLDETERDWEAGAVRTPRATSLRRLLAVRPRQIPRAAGRRVLVQASPHHLHRPDLVARILAREDAGWLCLVHDLIPMEAPEYARPGGAALHARRIATVARLADAVVTNSEATRRSLLPHLARAGRDAPVAVAHLGLHHAPAAPAGPAPGRPYFVCLGTIEPRKNHLLLLHLWRRLSEARGADAAPRLVLVGRRGWENEQVVDMLERCPALTGCVEEQGRLSDAEVRALLAGARALLLPSFAEGYGMPVPEALSLGVPVVCSDLPALREAGGGVPLHLDPLDGPAWERAVLDLADEAGRERPAQLARLAAWRAPTWDEHLDRVLELAERVA